MIAALLVLAACQPKTQPPVSIAPEAGHLVIAHTNDLHAHFDANRADWISGSPNIGGFAEIAGHVADLHETKGDQHVLYLDGGDVMTGTPLMEFEARGVRGGAMLEFMEAAGMDAWVLGNHEFDIDFEHVSQLVAASFAREDRAPREPRPRRARAASRRRAAAIRTLVRLLAYI